MLKVMSCKSEHINVLIVAKSMRVVQVKQGLVMIFLMMEGVILIDIYRRP